jgi:hypothetical protein
MLGHIVVWLFPYGNAREGHDRISLSPARGLQGLLYRIEYLYLFACLASA